MSMDHESTLDGTFDQAFHENIYRQAEDWRRQDELEFSDVLNRPPVVERWLRQTEDGWIRALRQGGGAEIVALPSHLNVVWLRVASGRDVFVAREGLFQGVTFSMSEGNLVEQNPHHGGASCVFKRRAGGSVTLDGTKYDMELTVEFSREGQTVKIGPHPAKTSSENPTPAGKHVVQIPDYPHEAPPAYGRYRTVWFRIGTGGDRYIHPGRVSAGCITCAPRHWPDIYTGLVRARFDLMAVGDINVEQ